MGVKGSRWARRAVAWERGTGGGGGRAGDCRSGERGTGGDRRLWIRMRGTSRAGVCRSGVRSTDGDRGWGLRTHWE